jgi:transcriptional regulator with XRE-family HTH domain
MGVGERIKRLRKERGLTQAQLADASGLSRTGLGDIERGKRVPQYDTLAKLSRGLGVSVALLFDEEPR